MTNYTFTAGATQAFVYATDTLTFPTGTDLTSVTIAANASNAANTDITVGGHKMTLTGVTVANLVATPTALLVGTAGGELFWGTSGADSITGTAYADAIYGLAGQDTLLGMGGNDTIFGGGGKSDSTDIGDSIDGGAGNDLIYGNAGLDTIIGSAGNDTVYGGGQNDSIDYSASSDAVIIYGGGGANNADNDTIKGSSGNDTLFGGAGANDTADGGDSIYGDAGADLIYGNGGADNIIGMNSGGADTVFAGSGDDTVNYSAETTSTNILIYGGPGNDSLTGGAGNDTIYGGNGASDGTDLNDTIDGGAGNDLIYGNAGTDSIVGSAANSGNDTIYGGAGNDTIDYHLSTNTSSYQVIYGGEGNDSIIGSYGPDIIYGADGTVAGVAGGAVYSVGEDSTAANTIDGQAGNDTIYGGAGPDSITSASNTSAGVDVVYGLGGNDVIDYSTSTVAGSSLYGGLGGDTINGSAYADFIVGGQSLNDLNDGADSITGNGGNDTVYGNSGNDTITTGAGNDLIHGGSGNDSINSGTGSDAVYGDDGDDNVIVASLNSWPSAVTLMGGSATSDTSVADSITFNVSSIALTPTSLIGVGGFEVIVTEGIASADSIVVSDAYALTLAKSHGVATLSNAYTSAVTSGTLNFDASGITAVSGARVSLTGGPNSDTLKGGAGNDTLIGGNGANTITGGLGADSMTSGTGADLFNFAAADFAQGNDTIAAGTGTDSVAFTDTDIGTITAISTFAHMTGIDAVNFYGTTNTHHVTIPAALVMNSDSKSVAFNYTNGQSGSAVFDASAVTSTSAGVKFNNVGGNVSGTATIHGTAGADSIIGSSAANVIYGGGGADTITTHNAADLISIPSTSFNTSGAVITAGTGTDTLAFSDSAAVTITAAAVADVIPNSDIEVINLTSGAYAHSIITGNYANASGLIIQPNPTASIGQSGGMLINAGTLNGATAMTDAITIIGGTGADTLVAGNAGSSIVGNGGADSLVGGTGGDLFVISGMTNLNASATVPLATVNGNTGTDTVQLNDTVAVVLSDSSSQLAHMTAVENLWLPSGAYAHNIVLTSTHGATGSLTVSPLTPASQTTGMTLNGSLTTDGTLKLVGGLGADVITGSASVGNSLTGSGGADTITGGTGADTISASASTTGVTVYGSAGSAGTSADSITTGSGNDAIYVYSSQLNLGSASTIAGGTGTDTLILQDSVAGTITLGSGDFAQITGVEVLQLPSVASLNSSVTITNVLTGTTNSTITTTTPTLAGAGTVMVDAHGVASGASNTFSIVGGVGADTLIGTPNNDTLVGYGGADIIKGGQGDDTIYLNNGTVPGVAGDVYRFDLTADFGNNTTGDVVYNYYVGATAIDISAGTLKDGKTNTLATSAYPANASDFSVNNVSTGVTSTDFTTLAAHTFVAVVSPVAGVNTLTSYTQAAIDTWGGNNITVLADPGVGATQPTVMIVAAYSATSGTCNAAIMELSHTTNGSTAYIPGDLKIMGVLENITANSLTHADFV